MSNLIRRIALAASACVLLGAAALSPRAFAADDGAVAARWWGHVRALANDSMEGRNTGSPAHKRAAEYVAAEFGKAGLEPAGVNGFIQPIKLKTRRILEDRSSLALVRDGKTEPLALGEDANIGMRTDPAPSIDAPLVFIGYGIRVPEMNFD